MSGFWLVFWLVFRSRGAFRKNVRNVGPLFRADCDFISRGVVCAFCRKAKNDRKPRPRIDLPQMQAADEAGERGDLLLLPPLLESPRYGKRGPAPASSSEENPGTGFRRMTMRNELLDKKVPPVFCLTAPIARLKMTGEGRFRNPTV